MLFRDFKTGLGMGLTALLLSSGAFSPHAAEIGGAPANEDSARTPDVDDRGGITRLRATVVAAEVFGRSARLNARHQLNAGKDSVWLMLDGTIRYPMDLDIMVSGASFADQQVSAVPKQRGLKYADVTAADPTADPPVMRSVSNEPLYRMPRTDATPPAYQACTTTEGTALVPVTMSDLFSNRGSGPRIDPDTNAVFTTLLANDQICDETGASAGLTIDNDSDVFSSLIGFAETGGTADGFEHTCGPVFPRNEGLVRFRSCGAASETEPIPVVAFHLSGIILQGAQGLAEAGSAVTLSADIKDPQDDESVDSASPTPYYVSRDTIEVSVRSGGRMGIDPFSDPPFSQIANPGDPSKLTATIGTVGVSVNSTTTGQLNMAGTSVVPVSSASLVDSADIMVVHGVLTDDAFKSISLGSGRTAPTAPSRTIEIDGDEVTFEVMHADLAPNMEDLSPGVAANGSHPLIVSFTGSDAISSWSAGEAIVSLNDDDSSDDLLVPPGASGSLSAFSRGGLSTELNMAQSSAGDGGTRYQSWVRIHNNGASDGSVTITVFDAVTGERLGHWDSPEIPAGGAIQVSARNLEDHLRHTPASGDQYNLSVEGDINGYVQHVMWNSVDGLFSDLSGFRAGGGLNTAP